MASSGTLLFGVRRRGSPREKGVAESAMGEGLQLLSLWWTCSMPRAQKVGKMRGGLAFLLASKYASTRRTGAGCRDHRYFPVAHLWILNSKLPIEEHRPSSQDPPSLHLNPDPERIGLHRGQRSDTASRDPLGARDWVGMALN